MHFITSFLLCIDLSELKKWEIEEGNRLESLYRNRLESETIQLKTEINNKIEMIKVKLKENLETTKLRIHSQLEKERQVIMKRNV
jgi:guanylate kinase